MKKFDAFPNQFPLDQNGHVPMHVGCWRKMRFDLAENDPNEKGTSADEKARRIKYLDEVWWPSLLKRVAKEHRRLVDEHGESFVEHWQRIVNVIPALPHGFQAG